MVAAVASVTGARQRLARLKELASQTGAIVYERAKLAAEMLDDRDWLAAKFKGDEGQAADWLQAEYFADLGGLMSVDALAGVYRTFPDEADWREHRYSLKRLYLKWQEEVRGQQPKVERERVTRSMLEEARQEAAEHAAEARLAKEAQKRIDEEAGALRSRLRELELENANLKGRVAELERAIAAQRAA